MDCLAQTVDRALSGQTVDRLRKAWIKLAQSVDVGQTSLDYFAKVECPTVLHGKQ